ncbi:aspartate dehydrogenase [Methanobrevibacter filiformis]|uniref:L-aspartate dehydrogenase n=1 Tax=Methanobrevibacter filiformis TaxID=55758 RepID=A0A166D163_9EURY|nr:aspartate dehydrogenase [Methanobrevibacter filiformis]KZX15094.1 L-aspartate dehydrogenase [Methanobrevibacter filiformis]
MILGILGCGAIANIIFNTLKEDNNFEINYFYDNNVEKAENFAKITKGHYSEDFNELVDNVDMVLESASPNAVKSLIPQALEKGKDVIVLSIGALMDNDFRENIIAIAKKNNAKIYAPSGAIAGLDAIKAASLGTIDNVSIVTRKSPRSLNQNLKEEKVIFNGKASEAVLEFPSNINVASSLSLASHVDANVKIIVDPKVNENMHEITVVGSFGEIKTLVKNIPCAANAKTSILAAYSAIELLKSFNETLKIGL